MQEVHTSKQHNAAISALRECLSCPVFTPGEVGYDKAIMLWNSAVDKRPAVVVHCISEEDVSTAVKISNDFDLVLSVKGGGHDWGGRSLVDDGLVVDLSGMKSIAIDPTIAEAVVGGGVLAGELVDAADVHGLVPVVGTARDVGVSGFSLGGGYGPLVNKYGLGADNILSARVVLSNGDCVSVNASCETDLYWGLRGGGGNFGVVTELTLRLHHQPKILTGIMLFPWEDCAAFLDGFSEITSEGHEDLSAMVILLTADDGNPAPVLFATWTGDVEAGKVALEKFAALGSPSFNEIKSMSLQQFLAVFRVGERQHHFMRNRWVSKFSPEIRDITIDAIEARTNKQQYVVLHHFGGQAANVDPKATAFGRREEHYLVEIIACWSSEDDIHRDVYSNWSKHFERLIDKHAIAGGYANLLGPEERLLFLNAYGDNLDRLRDVKKKYDPENCFLSTLLIP